MRQTVRELRSAAGRAEGRPRNGRKSDRQFPAGAALRINLLARSSIYRLWAPYVGVPDDKTIDSCRRHWVDDERD
jgi:hypothetical protein